MRWRLVGRSRAIPDAAQTLGANVPHLNAMAPVYPVPDDRVVTP